ncbi:OmpA family protein [Dokdonia sp. Hel_I_53]|uniref:OmpA family protein n=1 Tax=Dokdonia sp. Hel_I_53 TaxID=1566287 RepID=UPI00119B68A0|nr:OmpA family protein [Dokdonia sp. Hel_I_53]TVZ52182.1 OmpA family protein [Dokdonia sp. Hel_I_53]
MKPAKIILIIGLLFSFTTAEAQFLKKLGKAAERAAKKTVERRTERETEKRTDAALDSVLDNKKRKRKRRKNRKNKGGPIIGGETDKGTTDPNYEISRASDFEPGAMSLFEDAFNKENQGDFPARWDTNGSGEITVINGEKWLRLGGNSKYIPMLKKSLPENYTVEFDMLTQGLDHRTSSQAWITLLLEDNSDFKRAKNWCMVELSPCQFIHSPGTVEKVVNGKREIRNNIGKDYRNLINGKSHIAIAVNKTRIRVWMNDSKLVDIPRLVPAGANVFKIHTRGLRDAAGVDELYISNFRIGAAGEDNRSKLITEGRLSTNAILFESGSDQLKSSSYKIIREIVEVLERNPEVRIQIIGHTDTDGNTASNLALSRKRAQAVKKTMTVQYGIASSRITTDGMGESQPIAKNSSPDGKAQNRRVEFIKL